MHSWGKISIWGSLAGISLLGLTILPYSFDLSINEITQITQNIDPLVIAVLHGICFFGSFYFLQNTFLRNTQYYGPPIQVLRRSFFLGWTFAFGFLLVWRNVDIPFGLYMCVMSVFHYSEFLVTSIINPTELTMDSFLLNHSKQYGIAAAASWIEYGVESYFFPILKFYRVIMYSGLIICIAGELLRKQAMFTASTNFTHIVRDQKVEGHELITKGVYSMFRHPSYGGWFWWSIGTQILLMNPICSIAYVWASWQFFASRIYFEEANLICFFGETYLVYQEDVPRTGVPFVQGYRYKME